MVNENNRWCTEYHTSPVAGVGFVVIECTTDRGGYTPYKVSNLDSAFYNYLDRLIRRNVGNSVIHG